MEKFFAPKCIICKKNKGGFILNPLNRNNDQKKWICFDCYYKRPEAEKLIIQQMCNSKIKSTQEVED